MNAVVRTTDTDIFVILAFQMYTINLSINLDIGSAKRVTASNVAETLGKENCATLLAFYVFSGDDYTMQCIQGKIPLRQLEKNPRFHIAYRQLGVECYIQQHTLEQLEQFTCLIYTDSLESSVYVIRTTLLRNMFGEDQKLTNMYKRDPARLPHCQLAL